MPEKDEQRELKKHLNNEPKRTKRRTFKTPTELAKFILTQEPGYVWLDGNEIKRKFPDMNISIKRINEWIETKEFRDAVYDYIPECTQAKASNMFDVLMYRYYKGQLELPMPHQGAIKIFGQISQRYDPTQKVEFRDGHIMDKEHEKEVIDAAVKAMLNRIQREEKEKREKEGKE